MKKALKQVIHATGLRRHHVAAARMYCERHFLATTNGAIRVRSTGRILRYHSIGQPTVGSGTETSLNQLADALLWVMKSNLKPIYGPERKANPVARRCADTTKAGFRWAVLGKADLNGVAIGLTLLIIAVMLIGEFSSSGWNDLSRT